MRFCLRQKLYTYLRSFLPCVSWLFSLQLPCFLHLQGGPLPPPTSAKLAHQTSSHCSSSSATPSQSKSGRREGYHCTVCQRSPRHQVSGAEQYQCSSSLQQLGQAHFAHRRNRHQDLNRTKIKIMCQLYIIQVLIILREHVDMQDCHNIGMSLHTRVHLEKLEILLNLH